MAQRLDQAQLDQIISEIRMDAGIVTQEDMNQVFAGFANALKTGKLHTPNRSGGANGTEITKKIQDLSVQLGDIILTSDAPAVAASQVSLGQADSTGASKATLDINSEEVVATGTVTPDKTYEIIINGLFYDVPLKLKS